MAKTVRTKYDVTIDSWENKGTDEEVWHSSDFTNVNKVVMLAIIDLYETKKYDEVIFVVKKHKEQVVRKPNELDEESLKTYFKKYKEQYEAADRAVKKKSVTATSLADWGINEALLREHPEAWNSTIETKLENGNQG